MSAMTSNTYIEIDRRLRRLNPPIKLDDHIALDWKNKTYRAKAHSTTLDGVDFWVKDAKALKDALARAKASDGERAFTAVEHEDQSHWALKLSFKETKGTGYREIWRFPELSDRPLISDDHGWDRDFSAQFGQDLTLPSVTSLHFGVTSGLCNVHIDETGFVMESPDGNLSLNLNMGLHTADELKLKTDFKKGLPQRGKKLVDRVSLIYPSSNNNASRMGPRINQVPYLRDVVGRLPLIGGAVGKVPLPGLSYDLVSRKNWKVKVIVSCGIHGDCSFVTTVGGVHDVGGKHGR